MKETRSLPAELFAGRTLIFQLAKNDFKKKYAGSYLGIVWAFVQPVVTVMVYWFVFGMIRSSSPRPVPFVLWLIAGLIPWFFFQDGLINGTNALLEYNYLVKNDFLYRWIFIRTDGLLQSLQRMISKQDMQVLIWELCGRLSSL